MHSHTMLVRAFPLIRRPFLRLTPTIASRSLTLTAFPRASVRPASLDVQAEFVKDTILYKWDNLTHLRIYQAAAVLNMIFWNYFGVYTLYKVADWDKSGNASGEAPVSGFLQSMAYLGRKYCTHLTAIAMTIGYSGLFLIGFFSSRVINTIIVKKGGSDVVILTSRYVAISKLRELKVPLKHISCKTSRDATSTYVTFKVKGQPFYFLVDKKGRFYDPFLFDRTIGMQRNIR